MIKTLVSFLHSSILSHMIHYQLSPAISTPPSLSTVSLKFKPTKVQSDGFVDEIHVWVQRLIIVRFRCPCIGFALKREGLNSC